MPDQTVPTPRLPSQLSPSGRRALAASVLTTAAPAPPACASLLVDVLDAATWALLGAAGLTPLEARGLLAALWVHEAE